MANLMKSLPKINEISICNIVDHMQNVFFRNTLTCATPGWVSLCHNGRTEPNNYLFCATTARRCVCLCLLQLPLDCQRYRCATTSVPVELIECVLLWLSKPHPLHHTEFSWATHLVLVSRPAVYTCSSSVSNERMRRSVHFKCLRVKCLVHCAWSWLSWSPWILNFTVWLSTPGERPRCKALQTIWLGGKFAGRRLAGNPSRERPTSQMSPSFPWTSLKLEDHEEDNKWGTCRTFPTVLRVGEGAVSQDVSAGSGLKTTSTGSPPGLGLEGISKNLAGCTWAVLWLLRSYYRWLLETQPTGCMQLLFFFVLLVCFYSIYSNISIYYLSILNYLSIFLSIHNFSLLTAPFCLFVSPKRIICMKN